jgi:phosphomevalonate kinase
MKIIIGITGKLGSGKDYITNNVVIPVLEKMNYRYLQCAFADQIKINVMSKNNITYEDVYENKTSESRRLLQTEGTEVGRSCDKDIWVKYLDNWVKVHSSRGINVFIISDVRFKNEYEFVKNNLGLMLKVVAPSRNESRLNRESQGDSGLYEKISKHASECDLDDYINDKYDMVIMNDINDIVNMKELQYKFEKIINECFK